MLYIFVIGTNSLNEAKRLSKCVIPKFFIYTWIILGVSKTILEDITVPSAPPFGGGIATTFFQLVSFATFCLSALFLSKPTFHPFLTFLACRSFFTGRASFGKFKNGIYSHHTWIGKELKGGGLGKKRGRTAPLSMRLYTSIRRRLHF